MPLRLEYPDKYRLWADLFRGKLDRVFIRTEEAPRLGLRLPIELALPGVALPIVVMGNVVGRRQKSERFDQGIFVRFPEGEVEKCRRFLGVVQSPERYETGRRAPRVHHELKLRYESPQPAEGFKTRNISDTGLFATCPPMLVVGQRVDVVLTLDDGKELPLRAEVAWLGHDRTFCGLHVVDVNAELRKRLEDAVADIRARYEAESAKRKPIVLADDDPDILHLLTTALTRANYEVFQSQTGVDALGLVRELQPRMVLLDILMPGVDGVDICKIMRADAELADTPVIFLSAMSPDLLHQVADEAGATDYMSKPLSLADLINMVGRYLR